MKINKIITTIHQEEMEITGATLLSIEEAETLLSQEERVYNNAWWLRSPGLYRYNEAIVRYGGGDGGFIVDSAFIACRPALKIENLKSSNLKIWDRFEFGGKVFKIISDNLAFCESDIGEYCFREDWKAEDANDYEKSDIKKYVDNWFEKAVI